MSRRKKDTPQQLKRYRARYAALSQPITLEEILEFSGRLVAVDYGHGQCWIYPGKSVGGASNTYARMWFRGLWVGAHRFALAIKEGCTLWDLEGFEAGHAHKGICQGGRCCNPEHLTRQTPPVNRWQRSQDYKKYGNGERTPEEKRALFTAMYPEGMSIDGKLFDEPWQSNASPELLHFLEMGLKKEFQNMLDSRTNTAQPCV